MNSPLLTIDVAHPPRHPDRVEEELLEAWGRVRNSSTLRVLKVVHGTGSAAGASRTREVVRNWIFRHRKQFRLVIDGEQYGIADPGTMELRGEVGAYGDTDLDAHNAGITVVWVR
jgi:hypothetical protein